MPQIALITGASSGIGKATAEILSKNGYDIIAVGRREDRLEELAKSCSTKVLPLVFDVRDFVAIDKAIKGLDEKWSKIDVLVNNAGLAQGQEPVHEGNPEDWDCMIDTNVKGVLYMAKAIAPGMIKRKKGHIVNIGSVAGKEVYKGGAVYNATKFAVDALTKGMRIDFLAHGIKVTSVCPGLTETEFFMTRFKGDTDRAKSVFEGFEPLKAEDIAEAVWFAVSRPDHVNVNDMLVMPTAQANTVQLHRQKL
jgi:3-hydroxy acid dehydrogenase / malonic semialdehyde reductase